MARDSRPSPGAALLLIDLQRAITDSRWGRRNNPQAERQIEALLAHWRKHQWPVWHVRHDSIEANSPYRPDQLGNDFLPGFEPRAGEPVIPKRTNSAFIGTGLENDLRSQGLRELVIAGVITNNSVEATVRMGGNLGFDVYLVSDGCFTFDKTDWDGINRTAQEVHAMTLANLDGEYCTVIGADALFE